MKVLQRGSWSALVTYLLYVGTAASYDSSQLDAALHHYETLHVSQLLHKPHPLPYVRQVSFHALGKDFRLQMNPDRQTLAKNFNVYAVNKNGHKIPHQVDTDNFLQGYLQDVKGSRVVAHLSEDGILSAVMTTPTATYHVEPSAHYVSGPHNFHMVVYEQAHVKPRLNATKMDFVYPQSHPSTLTKHREQPEVIQSGRGGAEARLKRQTSDRRGDINGDACNMTLVADHTVYQQFGRSVSSVARQLVLIVATVNSMTYSQTQWIVDSNGNTETGLNLTIAEVIVHEIANTSRDQYNTFRTDVDASDILSYMRLEPWQGNCLVHLFTSRDLPSGLLGLANIASPLISQTGGICSTRFRDSSGDVVIYNTGLSSFNNGGQTMVVSEMVRVVGHEVGHNWGSFHDPSNNPDCRNFLMNEYAQDGSDPNHSVFSSCSRRAIGTVLLTKAFCFGAVSDVRCGNYRLEFGESCDTGPNGDSCCTASCQLQNGALCSDINHECCVGCQVANKSVVCNSAPAVTKDCKGDIFCNEEGLACPDTPVPVVEGLPCLNGMCRVVNTSAVSSGLLETECVPVCSTFCNCVGEDECKVCCMEGEECMPANDTINLANGSECSEGICVDGVCSDRAQDNIQRIWSIITSLDINALRLLMMENIVGVVLIFTIPAWALAGYLVHIILDKPLFQRFMKASEGTDLGKWIQNIPKKKERMNSEERPLMGIPEESDDDDEQSVQPVSIDPVDDSAPPWTFI